MICTAQTSVVELEQPNSSPVPGHGAGAWFVLHTRVHQEKLLADDLSAKRIAHFLPLVRRVRYMGRRKTVVETPLFPGYLFLRGSIEEAYSADRSRRVAQILTVVDQARMDWELRNIGLALTNQATLDPYPYLRKGIRVEVRSGPLRGLQGIVEDRTKLNRLVLQVDILGQATSLELDGSLLDVLE